MTRAAIIALAMLIAGCAGAAAAGDLRDDIPITVTKPDGEGPFPAVVVLHDCSGLGPRSSGAPGRWGRELLERGYVVVIPDSFTTRGFPHGICTDASPTRRNVMAPRRAQDAYAALAHARTLPFVDGTRVGVMGGSHGGASTLAAMQTPVSEADPLARTKRAGFQAGVALYPACEPARRGDRSGGAYRAIAPLLILAGEKDDWTPAEACRLLAESTRGTAHPVAVTIYPGAHHAFDSAHPVRYVATRINPAAPGGRGATTGGQPEAGAAAIRDVVAFFAAHLK